MKATIKIIKNDRNVPQDKLADAEVQFVGGDLDGLRLLGFAIWRRPDGGPKVTFPARPFTVHGERRNFVLLRSSGDSHADDRLRELVMQAYMAEAETSGPIATA
jgi:hypothetical protein